MSRRVGIGTGRGGKLAGGAIGGRPGGVLVIGEAEPPPVVPVSTGDTPIFGVEMSGSALYRIVNAEPGVNPGVWADVSQFMIPRTLERSSNPRESKFTISTLQFTLIEDDEGLVARMVGAGLPGKRCTFDSGFLDVDWDGRDTLFTGYISDVEQDANAYRITAKSPAVKLDKHVLDPGRTTLHTAINSSVTTMLVVDGGQIGYFTVLIDSEYITYTARVDNGDGTWTLSGMTRGAYGSTAASHAANVSVGGVVTMSGHPLLLAWSLITATGLDEFITLSEVQAQIATTNPEIEMQFLISQGFNVKTFIETELLKPIGAYPVERSDGQLSFRLFDVNTTSAGTLGDEDCPFRARWRGNFPSMVNHVIWHYGWNEPTRSFANTYEVEDAALIAIYGDQPLVIQSKGLQPNLTGTADFLEDRAQAYIDRFGLQLPTMSATTIFDKRLLQPGDTAIASFQYLINMSAGETGFNGAVDIIGTRHHFDTGLVDFELFAKAPVLAAILDDEHLGIPGTPNVTVS